MRYSLLSSFHIGLIIAFDYLRIFHYYYSLLLTRVCTSVTLYKNKNKSANIRETQSCSLTFAITSNIPDSTPFPVSRMFILNDKSGEKEREKRDFVSVYMYVQFRDTADRYTPLSLTPRQCAISISLLTLNSS